MAINVEAFYDMINGIARDHVNASPADLTIDCEVSKLYNAEVGEYKVEYQGDIFSAYTPDPTTTYKRGERVYVLVPGGDFSRKKVILGRSAYQNLLSDADRNDLTNVYIEAGPNWVDDQYYGLDHTPLQICAVPDNRKQYLIHNNGEGANYEDQGWRRWTPQEEAELTGKYPERETAVRYPASYLPEDKLKEVDSLFQNYSASYPNLKIAAKFRTEFLLAHSNGEYALRVNFITNNVRYKEDGDPQKVYREEEPKYGITSFTLGFKQFNGAPYQFAVDTPQKAYFDITPGQLIGLHSIQFIQDGMIVEDIQPVYDEDGNLKFLDENRIYDRNNIFCDDIEIKFCKRVNMLDTPFYVWIEAPDGDTLFEAKGTDEGSLRYGRTSLQLVPHMLFKGEEVTKDCRIMWFREDLKIPNAQGPEPAEEDKDEDGRVWTDYTGPGWRPIEKYIDEAHKGYSISDSTGDLLINLYQEDKKVNPAAQYTVPWQYRYKLVCLYKTGEVFGEAIITIKNGDSPYDLWVQNLNSKDQLRYQLRINDHNKPVQEEVDPRNPNGDLYPEWFGDWYFILDDNSYNQCIPEFCHGPIDVTKYLVYPHVRFLVAAYDPYLTFPPLGQYDAEVGGDLISTEPIGYLQYELNNVIEEDGLSIVWEGKTSFNYTALNQAYDSEYNLDHTLAPRLNWVHGNATDYEITILGPDGKPLTSRQNNNKLPDGTDAVAGGGASPEDSMMTDIYVSHDNVIHFKLRNEYDIHKTMNTYTCKVFTVSNQKWYESTCEVIFTKDGESGTQGTGWTAPLRLTNDQSVVHFDKTVSGMEDQNNASPPYTMKLNLPSYPMIIEPNGVDSRFSLVIKPDGSQEQGPPEVVPKFRQIDGNTILLRPFVTKEGRAIESKNELGDERKHYRIRVTWDVRYPQSAMDKRAQGNSFLRICHPVSGDPLPSTIDGVDDGLTAVTCWYGDEETLNSLADGEKPWEGIWNDSYGGNVKDTNLFYNAVQIRYCPLAKPATAGQKGLYEDWVPLKHEDMLFNFVVYAQVEVFTDLEISISRKVGARMGDYTNGTSASGTWKRLKSIAAFFPVDMFILDEKANQKRPFDSLRTAINWPIEIIYDAMGYNPVVPSEYLDFFYDYAIENEAKKDAVFVVPESVTPTVHTVEQSEKSQKDLQDKVKIASYNKYSYVADPSPSTYRLRPRTHLNWQEGTVGCLRGRIEPPADDPGRKITKGWFFRNQVYHVNAYSNVDINGWDGQGIDINEENGTIFAPTIGAGFKGPTTNLFTGVLMGVNTGFPRKTAGINQYNEANRDLDPNFPDQAALINQEADRELMAYPWMVGLFGYQQGQSSFGLLENGTAFFGRKDRGGRIIIDGYNATIYGGANGEFGTPTIGDPMWNNMRLSLVDLTHATSAEDTDYTGVQSITQGYDGQYFGQEQILDDQRGIYTGLPDWYIFCWEHAYVKDRGALPWWWEKSSYVTYEDEQEGITSMGMSVSAKNLLTKPKNPGADLGLKYADLPDYHPAVFPSTSPDQPWSDIEVLKQHNKKINYGVGLRTEYKDLPDTPEEYEAVYGAPVGKGGPSTGFGPSRASTTPAIEIGQHPSGLMPGVMPWGSTERIMQDLMIPGDRNFMVTYDGTLWAMNGVFLGNVIGSNIIGGRIQGAQLGIGELNEDFKTIEKVDKLCEWSELMGPTTKEIALEELSGAFGAFSVDTDGSVLAKNLHLYGGSIDIGSFHIIGFRDLHGFGRFDDKTCGMLIQFGESCFVGPTHFYGNIGIGPNLNTDGSNGFGQGSPKGNLFQTNGQVGLGIILPNRDTKYHAKTAQPSNTMTADLLDYYQQGASPGAPQIEGEGMTLQQIAMFGLDTRPQVPVSQTKGEKYQGHFWPMTFRFQNSTIKTVADGSTSPTAAEGVHAYMTTMDLFRSKGYTVKTGAPGESKTDPPLVDGSNYFRVSPWGVEMTRAYICAGWQKEQVSVEPSPHRQDSGEAQGVRGFMGIVDRHGTKPAKAGLSYAVGITTWGKAPLIFTVDENYLIKNRRVSYQYWTSCNDEARNDPTITTADPFDNKGFKTCQTAGYNGGEGSKNLGWASIIVGSVAKPATTQQIYKGSLGLACNDSNGGAGLPKDSQPGEVGNLTGINFDPHNAHTNTCDPDTEAGGAYMWGMKKVGVHIFQKESDGFNSSLDGKDISEMFLYHDQASLCAKENLFLGNYEATLDWKDGGRKMTHVPDTSKGSGMRFTGGGWRVAFKDGFSITGGTNLMTSQNGGYHNSENPYIGIGGDKGHTEYFHQNCVAIHQGTVGDGTMAGGKEVPKIFVGAGQGMDKGDKFWITDAHGGIEGKDGHIWFQKDYADENHQHNIYARFA